MAKNIAPSTARHITWSTLDYNIKSAKPAVKGKISNRNGVNARQSIKKVKKGKIST